MRRYSSSYKLIDVSISLKGKSLFRCANSNSYNPFYIFVCFKYRTLPLWCQTFDVNDKLYFVNFWFITKTPHFRYRWRDEKQTRFCIFSFWSNVTEVGNALIAWWQQKINNSLVWTRFIGYKRCLLVMWTLLFSFIKQLLNVTIYQWYNTSNICKRFYLISMMH